MNEEILNTDGTRNFQANILLDNIKRLELENEQLKTRLKLYIKAYKILQEIKDIVTALYMNEWLQQNETARQSIQLLQDIINKAEEE